MKFRKNRSRADRFRIVRSVLLTALLLLALAALSSTSFATVVQSSTRKLNAGRADFGSGNHSFGSPEGNASITFDWNNGSGQLVSMGRVRGTIYWDSLFSGGCARLTIRFLNSTGTALATRVRDECGPGGDANNSANQTVVDESFASGSLFNISLRISEIQGTTEVSPLSSTVTQVTTKSFPVTINNGTADFGDGSHSFGSPDDPGFISFQRSSNGTSLTGFVDGILYWDSLTSGGCARLVINYGTSNGGTTTHTSTGCGPGGNANDAANEDFITDSFASALLSTIGISVFTPGSSVLPIDRQFGFAGQVGDFEVVPAEGLIQVNEVTDYSFTWTVPEPLSWHDLDTLEFRVMDGSKTVFHLRFREDGSLASVLNDGTGDFGKELPVGSNARLQSRFASLDLAGTTVSPVNSPLGVGPNSPSVKLVLPLRFKPSAAGKTYLVEVAAADDFGSRDPFALAGTVSVAPH